MTNLYFNQKLVKYYYTGDPVCDLKECNLLSNSFFVTFHPKKSKSYGKVYCHECMQRIQNQDILIGTEIRKIIICECPPQGSIPIPIQRIALGGNPNADIFSVATSNKGIQSDCSNVRTKDFTRLAGRESLEGAQIGLNPDCVDDKKQILNDVELDDFLLDMQNAVTVLPDVEKKKLLEDKDDE